MALTELDAKTALILVDLQKGIVGLPTVHAIEGVLQNASRLAAAFRRRGLVVVLVNVAGGAPGRTERPRLSEPFPAGWIDLVLELDQQPDDIVVTKRTWGAFASTNLDEQLKARGITQVVVAGVATGTGVESTARQAYEQGYNVTLAIDAMTDLRREAHDYSIAQVFPRLGETGTTKEIVDLLEHTRV
jgi:nicotinamidase-related amidase